MCRDFQPSEPFFFRRRQIRSYPPSLFCGGRREGRRGGNGREDETVDACATRESSVLLFFNIPFNILGLTSSFVSSFTSSASSKKLSTSNELRDGEERRRTSQSHARSSDGEG